MNSKIKGNFIFQDMQILSIIKDAYLYVNIKKHDV